MIAPSDIGIIRQDDTWRPCSGHGQVNGLAAFSGEAIATNGVLVAVRTADGSLKVGHADWFVDGKGKKAVLPYGQEQKQESAPKKRTSKKVEKKNELLDKYN